MTNLRHSRSRRRFLIQRFTVETILLGVPRQLRVKKVSRALRSRRDLRKISRQMLVVA